MPEGSPGGGGFVASLAPPAAGRAAALALVAAGLLGTAALALLSEGAHHEDDVLHHLMARWAWHDPRFLLDDWGRPGFTVLYFPLAWAGFAAGRLTSVLLSAAAAWLAYLTAERIGIRRPYLVPLLVYLEPMFTRLSYTTLTETALAFYLALAVWLWVRGRPARSAAVVSLGAVTRHEAVVFLVVWSAALAARRRWRGLAALAWAPAAHNLLALSFLGVLPAARFLHPAGTVSFGRGTLLHYVFRLPAVTGLGLVPLVAGGWWLLWRGRGRLAAAAAGAYFLTETLVAATGTYSSGGYARFLVATCPLLALSAAAGADWVLEGRGRPMKAGLAALAMGLLLVVAAEVEFNTADSADLVNYRLLFPWARRWGLAWAGAGALVVALDRLGRPARKACAWTLLRAVLPLLLFAALLQAIGMNEPYRLSPLQRGLEEAARFLEERYPGRPVLTCTPWVALFVGGERRWDDPPVKEALQQAPAGTLFVWDWHLAPSGYFGITEGWLAERSAWLEEVWRWQAPVWRGWPPCVRVFEKTAPAGGSGGSGGSDGNRP